MRQLPRFRWAAALAAFALAGACTSTEKDAGTLATPAVSRDGTPPAESLGRVTRHTDGDTLRVDDVKVRLIGIDTPEVAAGGECYGPEAAARTAALLPVGERVRLVYDVVRHDRYGRVLAYLYRSRDGLFVNADLVTGGYATALTVRPNVAHAGALVATAREARGARRGLWAACPAS